MELKKQKWGFRESKITRVCRVYYWKREGGYRGEKRDGEREKKSGRERKRKGGEEREYE